MDSQKIIFISLALLLSQSAFAAMGDEPLVFQLKADELETDDSGNNLLEWNAQAWAGGDLNKLWLKTEGERHDGETEALEVQVLYSKAIAAYWDLQAGIRHDAKPSPEQNWAVVGLQGLAPYFFETEAALFINSDGDAAVRFSTEYEMLFTQRLILSPELELNLYAQDIPELGIGSGLSNISAGLRLRYEIRREFAPYIGVHWKEYYGDTVDFLSTDGEEISETSLVFGLRFWF